MGVWLWAPEGILAVHRPRGFGAGKEAWLGLSITPSSPEANGMRAVAQQVWHNRQM